MVGLRIDPDDWKLPVTADQIVQRTLKRALDTNPETRGQVVLLHDSGGDREATVEALPRIIHELRARGFKFVLTSELAGLSRDQAMPPVSSSQSVYTRADSLAFFVLSTGGWLLQWAFLIGIILGLGRLVVVGALAFAQWLRSRYRQRTHAGENYEPSVSVIVPAYNEEMVIEATLRSLLASDYENFEIIVVDDGSMDRTSEVVREKFGNEPRVRLFTEPNAGKANALNFGLRYATGEIIIALDADTVFAPHAISALAHRFYDPQMGAVAGNAKVGNRINIVTRWQALEYITSQNMDRRAFASLNCITVVPGAVGAWRRDLLERGRRLHFGYAGRRSGSDAAHPASGLQDWLRRERDRLDRGPGHLARAGKATLSLGLWHASVHVETWRRAVPAALWRARFCRDAQRLDLSNHLSADLAGDGFDAGLHSAFRRGSIGCNSPPATR